MIKRLYLTLSLLMFCLGIAWSQEAVRGIVTSSEDD